MAKKFLVALDKSDNSLRAIKFIGDAINPSSQVTLMSIVVSPASACQLPELSEVHPLLMENIKDICVIEEAQTAAMEGFLDEARKTLATAGFSEKNITLCIRNQQTDIAGDILREARAGGYDTVIVGRRGISAIKQFMLGSVSNKIINHAEGLSVIVVD